MLIIPKSQIEKGMDDLRSRENPSIPRSLGLGPSATHWTFSKSPFKLGARVPWHRRGATHAQTHLEGLPPLVLEFCHLFRHPCRDVGNCHLNNVFE